MDASTACLYVHGARQPATTTRRTSVALDLVRTGFPTPVRLMRVKLLAHVAGAVVGQDALNGDVLALEVGQSPLTRKAAAVAPRSSAKAST